MKQVHTKKRSANTSFHKGTTAPKGWHPAAVEKHFSRKANSKTVKNPIRVEEFTGQKLGKQNRRNS